MFPNLHHLEELEKIATAAWHEVRHPSGAGESINPITNREQCFIRAVRADQAVAGWYLNNAAAIKLLLSQAHAKR